MPTAGGPSNIDDELLRENLPADIDSLTASPGKKVVRFALDLDDWKCKFGGTWERTDQTGLKEVSCSFCSVHLYFQFCFEWTVNGFNCRIVYDYPSCLSSLYIPCWYSSCTNFKMFMHSLRKRMLKAVTQ